MICSVKECNRTATLAHVRDGYAIRHYCMTHKWEGGPGWRVGHWIDVNLNDVSPNKEGIE